MNDGTPIKRRRGAQPGNQNAKGNRGNPRPRRNYGNRGGKGACAGNQYARAKARSLAHALLAEYGYIDEARAWLESNSELLRGIAVGRGGVTDPMDIAIFSGLTLEGIAEKGLEAAFGLFSPARFEGQSSETERPEESAWAA